MKLLLDTHLLLWSAGELPGLTAEARAMIESPENEPLFSAANLWEIAIKRGKYRDEFPIDARVMRRRLLDNGYLELPIMSAHTVVVADLPMIHKDPFDRLLIAQSMVEGVILLTVDATLAQYPAPVRLVA